MADSKGTAAGLAERVRQLEEERCALLERLREAEEARWKLEALMEHVPEGIAIADAPDVRIRKVSNYGGKMLGKLPNDLSALEPARDVGALNMFTLNGAPALFENLPLVRAIRTGEVVHNEEWLLIQPDGREISIICNAGPIRDPEGRITGGIVVWQDINQLRLAKRTLRTISEYRLALDSAHLGTWEHDFISKHFYLGEKCRAMFGTEAEELPYEHFLSLLHPDDRLKLAHDLEQTTFKETESHFKEELRVPLPDGKVRWLLAHAQSIFTGADQKKAYRLIGTTMDITELKEAEQALRESEERFRGTFENAAVGIAHVDLDGRFLRTNRKFCEIVGYADSALRQKTFREITHSEDVPGDLDMMAKLLAGEVGHMKREKRYIRGDGRIIWGNLTVSLQRSEQGTPLYYISVVEDITSSKEAAAALAEVRERLDLALRAVRGGVWHVHMNPQAPNEISDQIYLSPELKAVIGFAAAEFPDSIAAWHARIHPDDRPRVLTAARQYLAGASEQYEVEYRVCHRDGQWRWILSLGRILRDDHGRPVRWAGVDLNITEWKKMERELLRALEDLRVANRIKDEVMANISHELRTPMTVIVAALEILQQEDPPQRNHLFDISAAAAEQLLAIIEDLLDISLLERHEMEIHWQPFALRDCIENAVNETIGRAREKNLDIQLNIGPEIPETVRGDAQRLRQVLLNLLGNAVKFTEAGVIDVHVNCDDHLLVFSVEDTGIGIPAAQMELLFEIFSQADASSTRRHGGTGLGLAISKRLVELMGGKIWAESRPGGGSVFRFTLPL